MTMNGDGEPEPEGAEEPNPTEEEANLDWLLANFVSRTPGVNDAVTVSADGFLLASSSVGTDGIEQFAAVISGLNSLTRGASELYDYGAVRQVIVEMEWGYLFVMAVDSRSTIGVLADEQADVGLVGYEMAMMIDRIGSLLTPALIDELKNTIALRVRPE